MSKICFIWMVISAFLLKQSLCWRDESFSISRREDAINHRQRFRENYELRYLENDRMKQNDLREGRQVPSTSRINGRERLYEIRDNRNSYNREIPSRVTTRDRNIYDDRRSRNIRERENRREIFERRDNKQRERRENLFNPNNMRYNERLDRLKNVKLEETRRENPNILPTTSRINERTEQTRREAVELLPRTSRVNERSELYKFRTRIQYVEEERQLNDIRKLDKDRQLQVSGKNEKINILENRSRNSRVGNDERLNLDRIFRLERNEVKQSKLPLIGLNNISIVFQSCFIAVFLLKSIGYEKMAQKYNSINSLDGRGLVAF